jgi:hypothetical protein
MSDTPNGRIPYPGGYEQVTVAGKTWKLSRIGPGLREDFAAWAEEQAYARLEKSRKRIAPHEYARRLRKIDDDRDAGAYSWGFVLDDKSCGSAIWKALGEGDGPARMVQLLLREHHGDVPLADIKAAFEAAEKEAAEGSKENRMMAAMNRALDPNSASPSQETGITEKELLDEAKFVSEQMSAKTA